MLRIVGDESGELFQDRRAYCETGLKESGILRTVGDESDELFQDRREYGETGPTSLGMFSITQGDLDKKVEPG